MKVTTCLNPLHTALAVYGCVLGYKSIASEMENPLLNKLVHEIGREGMEVVVDPKILKPVDFLNQVLNERLPNKAIPDMPQRIATDTSQKIPVRFGETIKSYLKRDDLDVNSLTFIPLAIAGWCRYLLGLNDNLEEFELSSDPMLSVLRDILKDVKIGAKYNGELKPILSNSQIFGLNLYDTPLAAKIECMFEKLCAGTCAVANTLEEYLK